MPEVTGNAVRDFGTLVRGVQAESSLGGSNVENRELDMLRHKLKEMTPTEQSAACQALRQDFPELHGAVTGEAI